MPDAQTVPCAYKTGRTLGSGTYAVVKLAVHIETGKHYACKVISKKLMEGREHMVRNEIEVLKKVSQGHPNIVGLSDYFETRNNLYLVFDLMQGGELFSRIVEKGNFYERDAAHLVYTVCCATKYLHDLGIVHRDLKPENLLFADKSEDSPLLIADFGLSRIMQEDTFRMLTTTCGTPGYMAPEIYLRAPYGKGVDIWAIGVITYFLLCGFTPFDHDSHLEEIRAICAADFKFEPVEYWEHVSPLARDFISKCLVVDPKERITIDAAIAHPWTRLKTHRQPSTDLLPTVKTNSEKSLKGKLKGILNTVRRHDSTPDRPEDHEAPKEGQDPEEIRERLEDLKHDAEDDDSSQVIPHEEEGQEPTTVTS